YAHAGGIAPAAADKPGYPSSDSLRHDLELSSSEFAVFGKAVSDFRQVATELRVKDIDTQQPQEKLTASAPCQQAFKSPEHGIIDPGSIDLTTFAADLSTLMQKSDEVILAGITRRHTVVFSPSGQSAVSYFNVKLLRSWKGPHNVGDTV